VDAPAAPRAPLARFLAANVLFAAGLYAHGFLYNFYLLELGAGEAVMGVAAAALMAGGLAGLAPAGVLVDRIGVRAAYLLATALTGAGLLAGAVAAAPAGVFAAAFVAGAGAAAWRVASGPAVMELASERQRARVFSWNVGLLVASGAAWTALSGALPGWVERASGADALTAMRLALAAGGVLTLAAAVVFPRLPRAARLPATAPTHPRPAWRALLAAVHLPRNLAVLVGLVFAWMTASALLIPFFNLYFLRAHDVAMDRIGLLMAGAQALTALAIVASGEAAARRGPVLMLAVWATLFAPAVFALAMGPALTLAAVLFLVQGIAAPATYPLVDQVLLERAPANRRGVVASWRGVATEGSGLLGAAVAGVVLEAASFPVLFAAAGALGALSTAAMLAWLWRMPAAAPAPLPAPAPALAGGESA
jgi:MFS family permease